MNRLTRYVLRQLAVGMVFVTVGLLVVMWLTQSLRFVELIVNRGLSLTIFLELTALLLPNYLTLILPVALFAVLIFTYNKLVLDRELVVMRAAGLSQFALVRPALILALALTAFGYTLSLYFLPLSYEKFRELQFAVRNNYAAVLLQEGSFNTPIKGMTIYIRERSGESELRGIMVHDARKPDRPVTYMAKRGALVRTDDGPRVLLLNGNQQTLEPGGRLSILYFDSYTIDLASEGGGGGTRYREPRERWLPELFSVAPPEILARDINRFRVEGHRRLVDPLYNLTFALIAVSVMVSGGFSRRGQGRRMLMAIGLMIAVQIAAIGSANLAVKQLALVPLIYGVAFAPIVIALAVLWWGQGHLRRRTPMATA